MDSKEKRNDELTENQRKIEHAIQRACSTSIGVLDTGFLCRSVSVLDPKKPVCVSPETKVSEVVKQLQAHKVGCVVVSGRGDKVVGIFSERDLLLKVMDDFPGRRDLPVSQFMTADPVTQPPDATLAFVLNLMSTGGFRHLPLVDSSGIAIGIVSVKDVIDFIVETFTNDLLGLELA